MLRILKRIIDETQRDYDKKLNLALWVDRVTYKSFVKNYPYILVYGERAILPSHIELPTLQLLNQYEMNNADPLKLRMFCLIYVDEL